MKQKKIEQMILFMSVAICTAVLLSLCFNDGLDYDEAFSYSMIHGKTLIDVPRAILDSPYHDVAPLWYMGLRLWTMLFGDSFVVCKFFTVAGSTATMLLGATVIYRNWGFITALLYLVPAGLAPGLMHVGVNIRTYSWTVFLMTFCGLIAYEIIQKPDSKRLWTELFLTTLAGLYCHHFTAFCYLFIYFYLFVGLFFSARKRLVTLFLCGGLSVALFGIWIVVSGFFELAQTTGKSAFFGVDWWGAFSFLFETFVPRSVALGKVLIVVIGGMVLLFRKRFLPKDRWFILLCFVIYFGSYLLAAIASSFSEHFFSARYVMHALALFWLALAIAIPRINRGMACFYGVYIISLCAARYSYNYSLEYNTTPYLEETYAYIDHYMEPGDIVIYNAEEMFSTVYQCYMPEQNFICFSRLHPEDLPALCEENHNIWFFRCNETFFPEEWIKAYGITWENVGHYGFQIMENATDFDLLKIHIE